MTEQMTEIDEVDHRAEHYAMTGSPVCWCSTPPGVTP